MSLVRLLTAGKSLVGLQDSASRYRVTGRRLLPQFAAKQNPFRELPSATESNTAATAASDAGEPVPVRVGYAAEALPPQVELAMVPEPPRPVEPSPVALRVEATAVPHRPGPVRRAPEGFAWAANALGKVRDWVGRTRARPARSAVPAFSRAMVQTELSLDNVKVVRNDLRDSDLEVVTVNRGSGGASARALPVEEPATDERAAAENHVWPWLKNSERETSLARVAGRLFGMGKP